jgi:hypothetical protein
VYGKAAGVWTLTGNLRGPQGLPDAGGGNSLPAKCIIIPFAAASLQQTLAVFDITTQKFLPSFVLPFQESTVPNITQNGVKKEIFTWLKVGEVAKLALLDKDLNVIRIWFGSQMYPQSSLYVASQNALYVTDLAGKLRRIDTSVDGGNMVTTERSVGGGPRYLASDGNTIACSAGLNVIICNLTTLATIQTINIGQACNQIVWNSAKNVYAVARDLNGYSEIDPVTYAVNNYTTPSRAFGFFNGKYYCGEIGVPIVEINALTNAPTRTLPFVNTGGELHFTSDRMYSVGIRIGGYDLVSGALLFNVYVGYNGPSIYFEP